MVSDGGAVKHGAEPLPGLASGWLGGQLMLLQPERGYRAGLDAALLGAAVEVRSGETALEAGAGVGAALLAAALHADGGRFVAVERDPVALQLLQANIDLNGFAPRVQVAAGDVGAGFRALAAAHGLARVDHAFSNPPFFDDPGALRAPAPGKQAAWMAENGLGAWITFLLDAVRDGGSVTVIHRADRLADLLAALTPRAGGIAVRPVQPRAGEAAKRVLVRAHRGARAPMRLLPPLVLHEGAGWTAEAEALLRGEARLGWG